MYVYGYEETAEANFCSTHQVLSIGHFTTVAGKLPFFSHLLTIQ